MFSLLAKGGPVMVMLYALSILGLYIIIQKVIMLRSNNYPRKDSLESIKHRLQAEGRARTAKFLRHDQRIVSQVLASVIENSDLPSEEVQTAIAHATRRDFQKLDQNMGLLSSIITVAPILGLIGTVLGLMDIFNVISGGGIGDPTLLSGGIAKALITTVTGLSIALPFIFLYEFINRGIETFVATTESYANDVLYYCRRQGGLQP